MSQAVTTPWFYRVVTGREGSFTFINLPCEKRYLAIIETEVPADGSGSVLYPGNMHDPERRHRARR